MVTHLGPPVLQTSDIRKLCEVPGAVLTAPTPPSAGHHPTLHDEEPDWGASVSGRQRRLERRLPRRLWRSRWARRFPMAEPACWAISSRKARSGSRRISKRYPASSHHKDRVHTLAPRPTRGIGFNGWNPGMKKRPACARRSASVALFGHTPTTTCRSVRIGQAIGQVSW